MKDRVLIVGAGGIGGVLASNLLLAGHSLSMVARREELALRLRERGPVLRDRFGDRFVKPNGALEVVVRPAEGSVFDFIFLATPPNRAEEAAREVSAHLAPGGAVVCFQNGLAEERLAPIVGAERVLGAVVAWGASNPEPGVFERTSEGGFSIGRLDGAADPRLGRLAALLEAVGPVEQTSNLRGARWSKLAINCAVSSLGTAGGDRLGALLRHRFVRALALEVISEAVAVAKAEGVRLEKLAGTVDLEWLSLRPEERLARMSASRVAKHALLLAVGAKYRRLRSSMLAGIERGREPPIAFLNGEVVERGRRHGIPTPVNAALVETIRAIWRKELKPGVETLRRVVASARPGGSRSGTSAT